MVDYSWVASLLWETDEFATQHKLVGVARNIELACAALLSDAQQQAKISPEAEKMLKTILARQAVPDIYFNAVSDTQFSG